MENFCDGCETCIYSNDNYYTNNKGIDFCMNCINNQMFDFLQTFNVFEYNEGNYYSSGIPDCPCFLCKIPLDKKSQWCLDDKWSLIICKKCYDKKDLGDFIKKNYRFVSNK